MLSKVAFPLQFDDVGVRDEPVDGRHGQAFAGNDAVPFAQWLVCGDDVENAF